MANYRRIITTKSFRVVIEPREASYLTFDGVHSSSGVHIRQREVHTWIPVFCLRFEGWSSLFRERLVSRIVRF